MPEGVTAEHGAYVANNILGKLHGAWGRLRGRGDDSAVLMVFAQDGEAGSDAKLSAFLSQAMPALTSAIDAPHRALSTP